MGGFVAKCWEGIKWIGNCINNVINWWKDFMEQVNNFVFNFLNEKRNLIETANNPQAVGETCAINKEIEALEEKAKKQKEKLSSSDIDLVNQLCKGK